MLRNGNYDGDSGVLAVSFFLFLFLDVWEMLLDFYYIATIIT